MQIDLWIKIGSLSVAVITVALAIWKLRGELFRAHRGNLREEYKFAKEFLDAYFKDPKSMHTYTKQKGFAALVGGNHIDSGVVEYLLTIVNPVLSIERFVVGKKYLVHQPTAGDEEVAFTNRYLKKGRRGFLKAVSLALLISFYSTAVCPLFLNLFHVITNAQLVTTFPITLAVFMPLSALALKPGVRINRAEALVATPSSPIHL
jgi:hypothetical protein